MPMFSRVPVHTQYGLVLGVAVGLLGILAALFPPLQEISATADLSWLSGTTVSSAHALPQVAAGALLLAWGIVLTLLFWMLPASTAWLGVLLVCAVYFGGGYMLFAGTNIWIPLFIPLLVQAPFAVCGVTLWRHWDESHKKRSVRDALGQYLPVGVADDMADAVVRRRIAQHSVYGVCLSAGAEPDAMRSERMSPQVLGKFMRQYFAVVFAPVRRRHGCVSDVAGDSMLALWAALDTPNVQTRKAACQAALEIMHAVGEFNHTAPVPLLTCIGVHTGEILRGGGRDQYRAAGDVVSTSARLQGLNKILGTRVLVSRATLERVDGLLVRELGEFMVANNFEPISVCELIGESAAAGDSIRDLCVRFASARQQFIAREFSAAELQFKMLVEQFPGDGPAQFFAARCREYQLLPPHTQWSGVLSVSLQ